MLLKILQVKNEISDLTSRHHVQSARQQPGAGGGAGAAVLLHLRFRQCSAWRIAADLRPRDDAAPVRLFAGLADEPGDGAHCRPDLSRLCRHLRDRLSVAF